MFSLHAAGDLYAAANHPLVKSKSLQAVNPLFGYPDGQLEAKHQVFKTQGWEFGVFDPSGFIMEGDQPDVFYGGESIYHIAGALAAVMDRDTGAVPESWQFLVEVMERLDEWREYQRFFDPGRWTGDDAHDDTHIPVAGSGFCGRTGATVPAAQSDEIWTHATLIDLSPVSHPRARPGSGGPRFPSIEDTSGDSVPERVDTDALRLGRDYLLGDEPQYVYVALNESRGVRLSTQIYEDPYQTKTSVRAVHIDLHGDPGSSQPTPASETVTYEITLTSPHSP